MTDLFHRTGEELSHLAHGVPSPQPDPLRTFSSSLSREEERRRNHFYLASHHFARSAYDLAQSFLAPLVQGIQEGKAEESADISYMWGCCPLSSRPLQGVYSAFTKSYSDRPLPWIGSNYPLHFAQ